MISVVMPCYNGSRFVGQAIESILRQTFRDFEFIIIDDGSTDNSLEIIKGYAVRDKRIRVIELSHQGICVVGNLGISESKYSWIARMDSDDVAFPRRLERQLEAVSSNGRVVAWGSYVFHINSQGMIVGLNKVGPIREDEFVKLRKSGMSIFLTHSTALLNKEAVRRAGGYDPAFSASGEDLELFSRMSELGMLLTIPEPLLYYRIHSNNLSSQQYFNSMVVDRYVGYRNKAMLKHNRVLSFNEFKKARQTRSLLIKMIEQRNDWGAFCYRKSAVAYCLGKRLGAVVFFIAAFFLRPLRSMKRVWEQKFSFTTQRSVKKISQTLNGI